jgi:hypothetical protein
MEKEKINYYQLNKNEYKEKYGKKVNCPVCNCNITYWNLSTHRKTKKHILLQNNKNLIDNIILENIELKNNLKHIEI